MGNQIFLGMHRENSLKILKIILLSKGLLFYRRISRKKYFIQASITLHCPDFSIVFHKAGYIMAIIAYYCYSSGEKRYPWAYCNTIFEAIPSV